MTAEKLYAHWTQAYFEEGRKQWSHDTRQYTVDGRAPVAWAWLPEHDKKLYRNLARRVTPKRAA